jgi:endonuclease YncB( thermonuclease family)
LTSIIVFSPSLERGTLCRFQQRRNPAARAPGYLVWRIIFRLSRPCRSCARFSLFRFGMGGWGPLILVGLLCSVTLEAHAQDVMSRCGGDPLPAGRVARIVDGRSFVLDDGREIRLASIEVPAMSDGSPAGPAAEATLAAMLVGEAVTLRSAAPTADRYGRTVTYTYTPDQGRNRSVAHTLLAQGHARVGIEVGDPACVAELLSQERIARIGKIGLWSDPQYGILAAGNLTGLVAGRGRFAVVEGKVLSVRESGGTIYVNFGRRWSQALTVTISKRQERIFSGAGREPRAFENRFVRVRGWIEVRNGPQIEASRPEQIELIAAN